VTDLLTKHHAAYSKSTKKVADEAKEYIALDNGMVLVLKQKQYLIRKNNGIQRISSSCPILRSWHC
jgi:hypothetical protein